MLNTIASLILAAFEWEDKLRIFGIKLINVNDLTELVIRLSVTLCFLFFVIHYMYSKNSKQKDYYFSYFGIGVVVFLLCFLLNSVKLELGFALGLFAIFGIIRYRTDAIPIKEMTYLFIVIGISVINALASKKVSYAELMFTNSIIVVGLWFLEKRLLLKREYSMKIVYEKIENIHLDNEEVLLDDLCQRTGIKVERYEIKRIDFLKDIAEIDVFHYGNKIEKS